MLVAFWDCHLLHPISFQTPAFLSLSTILKTIRSTSKLNGAWNCWWEVSQWKSMVFAQKSLPNYVFHLGPSKLSEMTFKDMAYNQRVKKGRVCERMLSWDLAPLYLSEWWDHQAWYDGCYWSSVVDDRGSWGSSRLNHVNSLLYTSIPAMQRVGLTFFFFLPYIWKCWKHVHCLIE